MITQVRLLPLVVQAVKVTPENEQDLIDLFGNDISMTSEGAHLYDDTVQNEYIVPFNCYILNLNGKPYACTETEFIKMTKNYYLIRNCEAEGSCPIWDKDALLDYEPKGV